MVMKSTFDRAERIEQILKDLDPLDLRVINDTAAHRGHVGDNGSGESHFILYLTTERFQGLSRVARQRLVMDRLAPEFATGLHAVTFHLKTPDE